MWTSSGLIPIETVQPGVDQAITLNEATGLLEFHAITDLIVTEQSSLLRLTVIHESGHREVIDTTDEHPFYEEARISGWVRADGLSPGDVVRTMGGAAVVDALSFGNERVTVYNLTVADSHTYLVGPDATWVHNTWCPRPGDPWSLLSWLKEFGESAAPKGWSTKEFKNFERRLPEHRLGTPITYKEWDLGPTPSKEAYKAGQNRGTVRMITGSDGSAWYTEDHYLTFIQLR